MSFSRIGSQSRKTGIFARNNIKRDTHNLEDLDDFFESNGKKNDNNAESTNTKTKVNHPKINSNAKKNRGILSAKSSAPSTPSQPKNSGKRKTYATPQRSRKSPRITRRSSFASSNESESSADFEIEKRGRVQDDDTSDDEIGPPQDVNEESEIDNPSNIEEQEEEDKGEEEKDENEEEESSPPPPPKKSPIKKKPKAVSSKVEKPVKKPTKSVNKSARTTKNIALSKSNTKPSSNEDANGVRRSSRVRVPPVAFWKNEKVLYEYDNREHVPTIKDVVTIADKEPSKPVRRPRKPVAKTSVSTSKKSVAKSIDIESIPGASWMNKGVNTIEVFETPDPEYRVKVSRTVAWAKDSEKYEQVIKNAKDNFKLAILFSQEQEFAASGMLAFPPGGRKYLKNTDDTYFIFYVVSGVLEVEIQENEFTVTEGCSFEIPMGNMYQFKNNSKFEVKLFFLQTKCVILNDDDEDGNEGEGDGEDDEEEGSESD